MDLSEALTLAAVVVALGMGVMSLRQMRGTQKRQYRLGQLDEIIAWAIDIAKCESESQLSAIPLALKSLEGETQVQYVEYLNRVDHVNLQLRYQSIDTRSKYVKAVAWDFPGDLYAATLMTADLLAKHLTVITRFVSKEITEDDLKAHWQILISDALTLTAKAVKTKSDIAGLH